MDDSQIAATERMLIALRSQAARLLSEAPARVHSLRIYAGDAGIELAWPDSGADGAMPIAGPVPNEPGAGTHQVRAPAVGTFYRAPAPDAEPFVEVGDEVEVGQQLCVIEAMKLLNAVESEVAGTIAEILVEDGDAVEYAQPLFVVRGEVA